MNFLLCALLMIFFPQEKLTKLNSFKIILFRVTLLWKTFQKLFDRHKNQGCYIRGSYLNFYRMIIEDSPIRTVESCLRLTGTLHWITVSLLVTQWLISSQFVSNINFWSTIFVSGWYDLCILKPKKPPKNSEKSVF